MSEEVKRPMKRLYFCSMPFMNFVFKKGKMAVFKHHRYATDIQEEIEELDAEVASGHPNIRIDPEQRYLTAEMEDPMKALRAKFFKEFQEQLAAHVDPANDMGKSDQGQLRPQSSTDIAPVTVEGGSTSSAAKLVALAQKSAQKAK